MYYTYHDWLLYINVDYNQLGQTSQHHDNKYWALDLFNMAQGLCHSPTTLHLIQCCHIIILACLNVWMYNNTKFKIYFLFQYLFKWKYEYELLDFGAYSTYVDQLKIQTTNNVHKNSLLEILKFDITVMFQYMIKFDKYMYNLNIKHWIF
jgi:hypothetical protein